MKTLLRCGYLALVILSLVVQFTRGQRGDGGVDASATLAAGLERLNVQADRSAAADVLTGMAPSCEQPIQATLLRIDGSDDESSGDSRPSAEVVRYVFLGSVGENRDMPNMIGRWVWASVQFVVGWRSVKPHFHVVRVVLPRACPELATLEWAALSPWD
jgi:hypothetical protein